MHLNFTMNIPGLEDIKTTKLEQVEGTLLVVDPAYPRLPYSKGEHLKRFERLIYLFYKSRRYACRRLPLILEVMELGRPCKTK